MGPGSYISALVASLVAIVAFTASEERVGILDRRRVQARVCGDPLNILQEKRTAPHRMAMTRNTSLRRME